MSIHFSFHPMPPSIQKGNTMALITCPECSGTVSDKAYSCPHCGYPMQSMPATVKPKKRAPKRRPNGSGTVVKLSGKRKNPFQVRVNTRINDRGYPEYDIIGNYPDRVAANIALAEYNKKPYDVGNRKQTFRQVFESWFKWKFKIPHTQKNKTSTQTCAYAAYKKCSSLHDMIMVDIKAQDMQDILEKPELSHATLEHIVNLFKQMYKYCLQFEIVEKDYSQFIKITKADDDEQGVPFTHEELKKLWQHKDVPFVDTILIYCYSGWRINELSTMPLDAIDLQEQTFTGGLKTRYSRDRVVPIHSAILPLVAARHNLEFKSLIYHDGTGGITQPKYREYFAEALKACGIETEHTPHDCRHTFNTLLDEAGVDRVARYKLMGHKGKDINESVYTHKNLKQLREAVEAIKIEP